jgi:hypothetical protein
MDRPIPCISGSVAFRKYSAVKFMNTIVQGMSNREQTRK